MCYNKLVLGGVFCTPQGKEFPFTSEVIGFRKIDEDPDGLAMEEAKIFARLCTRTKDGRIGKFSAVVLPDNDDATFKTFTFPITYKDGIGHGCITYKISRL